MDFVGDYQKKQKLAEALRKREAALLGAKIDSGPIVTQASGAFPGMVQANWAAPLAVLGQAYFANKAGEKATEAEQAAADEKRNALYNIMGMQQPAQQPAGPVGGPADIPVPEGAPTPLVANAPGGPQAPGGPAPGFQMTPDKLMALQELGVDPAMIKMMQADKLKMGDKVAAAKTPGGRALLVLTGDMTQAENDAITKAEKDAEAEARKFKREDYDYEQAHKRFKPDSGGGGGIFGPGGLTVYGPDGNPVVAFGNANPKRVDKGGADLGSKDAAALESEGNTDTVLAGLRDFKNKIFEGSQEIGGPGYRVLDTGATMLGVPDSGLPSTYNQDLEQMRTLASTYHLQAMDAFKGLGALTEAEQAILTRTEIGPYDTAATIKYKLDLMEQTLQNKKNRATEARKRQGLPQGSGSSQTPLPGTVPAPAGDDDALLDKYAPK